MAGPNLPRVPAKPADPARSPSARENRDDSAKHFDKLFPCSFRGIQFPVITMSVSLSHDMAEHRYYGVSAANVEMTGRNPLTFEAEIPFIASLVPGKNERWSELYPTTFKKFLGAFDIKDTGYLDTPELAGISVKPVSLEYKHDAQVRNGVIVTARWIETIDATTPAHAAFNPVDRIRAAAKTLDAEYTPTERTIQPVETSVVVISPKKKLPVYQQSFSQMVNELAGVVDTLNSKAHILANKPEQLLYRVKKVQDSIERAANPMSWPGRESCERMEEALNDIKSAPGKIQSAYVGSPTLRYTSPTRMSLSQLAIATANTVDQLLKLNPRLATRPTTPAGSVVRYYSHGRILPF